MKDAGCEGYKMYRMPDVEHTKYERRRMRRIQNIQDARCERDKMRDFIVEFGTLATWVKRMMHDVKDVLDVKTCYKRQIGQPFVLLGLMRQAVRSNHRLSIANRTFAV